MKTLSIPYDEGLLVLLGVPPEAFEQEARFLLASNASTSCRNYTVAWLPHVP